MRRGQTNAIVERAAFEFDAGLRVGAIESDAGSERGAGVTENGIGVKRRESRVAFGGVVGIGSGTVDGTRPRCHRRT